MQAPPEVQSALEALGQPVPWRSVLDDPRAPIELPRLLSAIYIEEWDKESRQSRLRLAGEFHREVAGFNVQGLSVDEHAAGKTAEIWKRCDRYNFFELRPTFCGYDLGHVKKAFRFLADLTLPVRAGPDEVLAFGFIWPYQP